jgi:Macrocin-O-methyltransferase (TylF)
MAREDRKLPAKILLTRLGARCNERTIYNLNGAFNYLHVGWWLRAHRFDTSVRCSSRYAIFDRIALDVGRRKTLYIEFGVYEGLALNYWTGLLQHPEARLHGFDSFVGLPHDWSLEGHPRGYFSTGGVPPRIEDDRVEFFVGWFEETLPRYEWPESDVLVVMVDADLYSSTKTVLEFVKDRLMPGSYLYFDQLHHRCDELRAFAEFLDENEMVFDLVGACRDLSSVGFKRIR